MGDLSISQVSARPGRIGIRARQMFDGYRFQRGPVLVVVEDVLTGATAAAAASCGLGHRKGRIAPGYDADLLAVAAGVDHDPAGLCDVKAVWRSGTQVPLQASAVGYNTPS
ncbi:phosphonate metabolism protein PhnM [Mycobacterium tuberculosis]|nr:phosphonate metabolism protein PhnM [Mycobacterium tuberculosis]